MKLILYCFGVVIIICIIGSSFAQTRQYDFNGVPRTGKYIGDKPDIGAFEYVPSLSSPESLKLLK